LPDARPALGIDQNPVADRVLLAATLVLAGQGRGSGAHDADVEGANVLFRQDRKLGRPDLQQRRQRRGSILGSIRFVRAQPGIFDRPRRGGRCEARAG
jgi:hypothetical protein